MLQWRIRNQIRRPNALECTLYFEDRDTGVRLFEEKEGKQARWVLVIEADTGTDLDEMKKVGEREWVERQRPRDPPSD